MNDNGVPGTDHPNFRLFSNGTEVWAANTLAYVIGGSPGAWVIQDVDSTHGLPVSVISLPAGISTAANQTEEIASLASIDSKLPAQIAISDAEINPTTLVLGSLSLLFNGTSWDREPGHTPRSVSTWDNNTPLNSNLSISVKGLNTVVFTGVESKPGTAYLQAGEVIFEVDDGSGKWFIIQDISGVSQEFITGAHGGLPGGFISSRQFNVAGYTNFRVRLEGVITLQAGTGLPSVSISIQASPAVCQSKQVTFGVGPSLTVDQGLGFSGLPIWLVQVVDEDGGISMPIGADPTTAIFSNAIARTSPTGGATPFRRISTAGTNAINVKSGTTTLYMLLVVNTNASPRYLKLYDAAGVPVPSTDIPVLTFTIPGNVNGGGFSVPIPSQGIAFLNGLGYALTTGVADGDVGAVAANEITLNGAFS